jgi:hypothetical protein
MTVIWTPTGNYSRADFEDEADLEKAIVNLAKDLFGPGRIYLDIKKKIGNSKQNIPDAYLLDLSSSRPRLYVVENELSRHHPSRHIAIQLVEFMSSFFEDKNGVRNILVEALNGNQPAKQVCESYIADQKLHSVEDLIHKLVFETEFAALVVIDEQSESLETILNKGFAFGVEVLELARYEDEEGNCIYNFDPFLAGLRSEVPVAEGKELGRQMDVSEVDTVVVPAWPDEFKRIFLGENRWYAVRIRASIRPQIKFVAAYQTAPVCAITHMAPVASIQTWQDTDKVVLNFSAAPRQIGPLSLQKDGKVSHLQNLRYTSHQKLESAKTLDEAF